MASCGSVRIAKPNRSNKSVKASSGQTEAGGRVDSDRSDSRRRPDQPSGSSDALSQVARTYSTKSSLSSLSYACLSPSSLPFATPPDHPPRLPLSTIILIFSLSILIVGFTFSHFSLLPLSLSLFLSPVRHQTLSWAVCKSAGHVRRIRQVLDWTCSINFASSVDQQNQSINLIASQVRHHLEPSLPVCVGVHLLHCLLQ
jgi:hypothetical protein